MRLNLALDHQNLPANQLHRNADRMSELLNPVINQLKVKLLDHVAVWLKKVQINVQNSLTVRSNHVQDHRVIEILNRGEVHQNAVLNHVLDHQAGEISNRGAVHRNVVSNHVQGQQVVEILNRGAVHQNEVLNPVQGQQAVEILNQKPAGRQEVIHRIKE